MRSMTGFGAGEATTDKWRATVELSGVNRKQLDLSINLPPSVSAVEPEVRQLISSEISRGRINARINLTSLSGTTNVLVVDQDLAGQYVQASQALAEKFDLEFDLKASDLIRGHGLMKIEEAKVEIGDVEELIKQALKLGLSNLAEMQLKEGLNLQKDLESRITRIETEIATVSGFSREVVEKYRQSLFSRLAEAGLEINLEDERVLREIGLFAEKSDITEEITRIGSHVQQFRSYFASEEPVGRPLDFLCQELNRELNTIGSKANHASIAQSIVQSKTELEKIREQVQNIQ